MKFTGLPALALACAAGGAVLSLGAASAQAEEATQDASGVIEEIIVTSRRRAESQQDVPVSVTAFQQDDIDRVAPKTLRDFDGLMPNVFIGQQTAAPSVGAIFIRGLGYADLEKTQAPAVGLIIDGVFQGTNTGQLIDTFDVEQVEVNRGPQGVLFGKNTTGGSIVVNRVKPDPTEFGAKVSAQVGNESERIFKGRVNIPLGETAALKVGGVYKERESFYTNINTGFTGDDVDYRGITAAFRWQPTDQLDLLFTYDNVDDDSNLQPQDPRYNGLDPFITEADIEESALLEVDSYSLNINWDTEAGTFTSITAFVDQADTTRQDFDGSGLFNTAIPIVQLHTLRDQTYEQFSQEFRFSGEIGDNLSYTVGAFYLESELEFYQGNSQILQFPEAAAMAIIGLPGVPCDGILPRNPAVPGLCQIGPSYTASPRSEDVESLGIFGAVTWNVTDRLELGVGIRYIDEEKDFDSIYFNGAPVPGAPQLPAEGPLGPATLDPDAVNDSWDDTIVKVTASYAITDNNLVYGSFAQGFRSGGNSIRGIDPAFQTYEPETVDAWELGFKNDFFDGRLRANVAFFYTEMEGLQFGSIITNPAAGPGQPGTNTIINNADETEIWGGELEVTALLHTNLTLIATYGYQEADNQPFSISSQRVPLTGDPAFPVNDARGTACNAFDNPTIFPDGCPTINFGETRLARSPEWNWSATLVYGRELGDGYFQASVTGRGQDDFVIVGGATITNPQVEDGYTLIDSRISYEWNMANDSVVTLSLVGKNLTDEEYREQALPLGANGGFQGWAPPRTYAAEVVWSL
ncbi:MAG: TonB-dependent receptor [Pseudomonadota bacterium]